MPLIITATDFSDTGKNAVEYACYLASAQKAQLIIIHSYIIPVMFSDVPMPASVIDDAQRDAEKEMNKLVSDMTLTYPEVDITGNVIYGDIVDAIEEYTKENKENQKPWMIVVGNSSPENDTWPDSTLIAALKNLQYPVLAVPPHAICKPVSRICFAFDNKHTGNDKAFTELADITRKLNAELHILHARTSAQDDDNGMDTTAKNMLAPLHPTYHVVTNTDIDGAVQTFNELHNIDLLVLIPRKHSFFEGMFHKSHTKTIAHQSHIPIMALHEAEG